LPAPLRDLHPAVLRRFLDTGTAPVLDWLRRAAGELGLGDSAVADLEAADLVHSDGGAVTVAYPFSGVPTRHQVELGGAGAVRIGGTDIRDVTLASLRETVGVVTQDAHLFHDTASNVPTPRTCSAGSWIRRG
jgi:hypothetical protein